MAPAAPGFDFGRVAIHAPAAAPRDPGTAPIQRVLHVGAGPSAVKHTTVGGKSTRDLVTRLESDPRAAKWKRGWKTHVKGMAGGPGVHRFSDEAALADHVHGQFEKTDASDKRPSFQSAVYSLAKTVHSTRTGHDESGISLADEDMAVPHRFPFADIRDNVERFTSGVENATDLTRWTDRLATGTEQRRDLTMSSSHASLVPPDYATKVDAQLDDFRTRRDALIADPTDEVARASLVSSLNSLHGNVPDLGPHSTVNIPVSNRLHLNVYDDAPMSPGTLAAVTMSPHRSSRGVAMSSDGESIVTPRGDLVPLDDLPQDQQDLIRKHKLSPTTLH